MKTSGQGLSVLSIFLGLVWLATPAAAQTCAWSAVGSGINGTVGALTAFDESTGGVYALTVFDDGRGLALYAVAASVPPEAWRPTALPGGMARNGQRSTAECAVLLEQRLQTLGQRWILLSDRFEPSSPFLQRNIESLV